MRENFTYGSVRGAAGDGSPYRDSTTQKLNPDEPVGSSDFLRCVLYDASLRCA